MHYLTKVFSQNVSDFSLALKTAFHFFTEIFINYAKKMKSILLIALAVSVILSVTQALSCLRCDSPQIKCTSLYKLNCKGGLKSGVCGCCPVCAKIKGGKCGGPWNIHGECDCGLRCYKSPKVIIKLGQFNAHGVCIPR